MTFAWDRAQNPYEPRNRASYDLMYSEISAYVAEVEAINANKSRHLYIDNTPLVDANGNLTCPRHVVTNFRPDNSPILGEFLEQSHYDFVSKMITTPSGWLTAVKEITLCPSDVLE